MSRFWAVLTVIFVCDSCNGESFGLKVFTT